MDNKPEEVKASSSTRRKPARSTSHPIVRTREFNVSRAARDRYGFDGVLFSSTASDVSAHLHAVRELAHSMNRQRDASRSPEGIVHVSSLHAVGLIDQVYHHVLLHYRDIHRRALFTELLKELYRVHGREQVDEVLGQLTAAYPPADVYRRTVAVDQYLESIENGEAGREIALEELFLLWIENQNSAFHAFDELVGDRPVRNLPAYEPVVKAVSDMLAGLPPLGEDQQPLVELLLEPARIHPDSLEDQLRYIREHWGSYIGDLLLRILQGLDLFKEDHKGFFAGPGPGETRVYRFQGQEADIEKFSEDRDWMPEVVLLAKSTLVWLEQLSSSYGREVRTLDQIPDEELDRLAAWGITGLWLIGIWERSPASRRIKQIMGNGDAEASAYSLRSYDISAELGGWDALEKLKVRCAAHGIRLASDMVPNHTGLDSDWMVHHPERFISVPEPPFPSYTFTGENLSTAPEIAIHLEDHYYDRTDAAVVFKRVDNRTGEVRYIYHGNDGTHMPWNDTAQLDFLNPETRKAVIDLILRVARTFPIIRFDAAMTLAKRHFQRLWFPEPGTGGDIPSRADHGLTAEQFSAAMPDEFWREVVDRAAEQAPDTLLLAEAFWMMEGYFVRSLGMHRVYNSAFMNMLKGEENAKYRETIKNTLEFDRNILKRFVNFMNNPDEETAIVQFGREDKYFGVCTMMVTMPGLPMFGHGQVEGFTEKYGMEYRRAYLNERPDSALVARHEREIFPLVRRRHLFADVANFLLFDLYRSDGSVNENVFAYTNGEGHDRVLVLYNNAYEGAWGWIRLSAAYADRDGQGHRTLVQRDLADALGLHRDGDHFCLLYESRAALWFIRSSAEIAEQGIHIGLAGYGCQVFTKIREEEETTDGLYHALARQASGTGMPDIDAALRNTYLAPVYERLNPVVDRKSLQALLDALEQDVSSEGLSSLFQLYEVFLSGAMEFAHRDGSIEKALGRMHAVVAAAASLLHDGLPENPLHIAGVAGWLLLTPVCRLLPATAVDEWALPVRISVAMQPVAAERYRISLDRGTFETLLRLLLRYESWYANESHGPLEERESAEVVARRVLRGLCEDDQVTTFLGFNRYDDVVWYQKEGFEVLTWTLTMVAMCEELARTEVPQEVRTANAQRIARIAFEFRELEARSEYRVERLLGYES